MEKKVENRELVCASGVKNDTDLLTPEVAQRAPYYVYRLLCGAHVAEGFDGATMTLRSGGQEYILSRRAYDLYERIRGRIQREELDCRGISRPFNAEDTCRIFESAGRIAKDECGIDPRILRVYFLRQDSSGCGFYRVMQPARFLRQYTKTIYAEECDWLSFPLGQHFDVLVAPRTSHPLTIGCLRNLQQAGKVILYETDDLLSALPDWNPHYNTAHKTRELYRKHFIELSDGIITSTPELKTALARPDVTHVCTNGIDPELWPMKVMEQKQDVVRILWAGSNTHEKDLEIVVKPIKRLIEKFDKKLEIVWVGYAPRDFICGYQSNGRVQTGIAPQFRTMKLVDGCPVTEWPKHLAMQECHMAIAPLVEHDFNKAKSELKVLEAWALGIPIVATKIAPYERAIEDGHNGLLVENNPDKWYSAIKRLIENPTERTNMAANGLNTLKSRYVMPVVVEQYERALLILARGRTCRPECNAMIESRLNEKGWV